MAITTTPRFGLPQWGQGSDSPSRAAFNDAFDAIDDRAAYDDGAPGDTTLPATEVVNGRYAQTTDGAHRRLFRRSGDAWQQVGGNTWAETQYARADAALATGAAARVTSHPSLANPGATENWDGSSVRGGRQAIGDLNSGQPGALHVGDTAAAVDLATRGRIYARTTAAGQRGVVASAHADNAGPLFTARTAGGDPWQVDAQGRMRAQAPAAFGAAALATGVPLVSAPGASDLTAADLFADVGKPALRLWRAVGDVTPIGSIEQTRITLGRSIWSGGRVDLLAPNVNVVGAFDVTGDTTLDKLGVSGPTTLAGLTAGATTLGTTNTDALTGSSVTATGKLTAQFGRIESFATFGGGADLRSDVHDFRDALVRRNVRLPLMQMQRRPAAMGTVPKGGSLNHTQFTFTVRETCAALVRVAVHVHHTGNATGQARACGGQVYYELFRAGGAYIDRTLGHQFGVLDDGRFGYIDQVVTVDQLWSELTAGDYYLRVFVTSQNLPDQGVYAGASTCVVHFGVSTHYANL